MRLGENHSATLWRIFVMALVFLVMSCEADGDGGDCLGDTDDLIIGMSDGCGTGLKPIGDGCFGSCLLGGDGGCGGCGAGEGCDMGCDDCGGCGDCQNVDPYAYDGDVVEGAIQVHATNSLFNFINQNVTEIVKVAAGDELGVDEDGYIHFCMAELKEGGSFAGVKVCSRKHNCNVEGNPNGPNNGCDIKAKLGDIAVTPTNGDRVNINVKIDDVWGDLGSKVTAVWIPFDCTIKLRQKGNISAALSVDLPINPGDRNTEVYLGGDSLSLDRSGLDISGCSLKVAEFFGIIDAVVNGIVNGIGALSCRGCDTIADCGAGATQCKEGRCRDNSGRMCQGIQLGVDLGVDAAPLLQTLDPAAQGAIGVKGFLGSYTQTNAGGLQLGGRLGGKALPQSLCVPLRDSPVQKNTSDCRTGDTCAPLEDLNSQGVIGSGPGEGEPFHLGVGVAIAGINQVLWSAYSSGMLCLSIGGESDGLEMLGTGLVGALVGSLNGLTYGENQPLMIQLRPQYAPEVDLQHDEEQGAQLNVLIPELSLDFYTVADQRYARIFTLTVDIDLPLSVKVEDNQIVPALGKLEDVINLETIKVTNVEMVEEREVVKLAETLPTLIGSLADQFLGDDLIPPFDIPEIEGIQLEMVGPGIAVIEEDGQPAALGIFARLGFGDEFGGGLRAALEPVVTQLDIDMMTPKEVRAFLAARRQFEDGFSYKDLMPKVVAHMQSTGADLPADQIEYAYSINNGPWSYWQKGPAVSIDNPTIANEGRYNVRVSARRAGDATSGSRSQDEFSFVNDYTAPRIALNAVGGSVVPQATDNVYAEEELTMQYRVQSGAWSERQPLRAIDLAEHLSVRDHVVVDVFVEDPSGNARSVRRTFGEKKPAPAENNAAPSAQVEGCSSSSNNAGWLAALAFLGLLLVRKRPKAGQAMAASPATIAFLLLAFLMLAFTSTGCVDKGKGLRSLTEDCEPACLANEICINSECQTIDCTENTDCPGSSECQDGECSPTESSCGDNDDCEYGQICKEGACVPSECTTADECDQDMCDGDLLPYCDYDDYASVEAGECTCESSLALRTYGTWLRVLQLEGNHVVALTYNEDYGDLMFGVLNEEDNFDWTFIDGVPDGPVIAPPTGVRNGVRDRGDVAGRYVSAVAEQVDDQFVVHAAYQYEDRRAGTTSLRYARGVEGSAGWAWTMIDIDDLDVAGMFPSIALLEDTSGQSREGEGIGIIYMTGDAMLPAEGGNPAEYFSQVSTAYSATRTPESADDFQLAEGLDQAAETDPCANLCGSKAACLTSHNVCVPTASTCDPACGGNNQCVTWEDQVQCLPAVASSEGFSVTSRGLGLFSSAVVDDNGLMHVAYYDQIHGVLKYMTLHVSGNALTKKSEPLIVDGELNRASIGDVGRWTDIHVQSDGKVVIFYEDAGRAELRAAVIQGTNVHITILDDGTYVSDNQDSVANNRVGSSVFARARPNGGYDVYYQDTTDMVVRKLMWNDIATAPTGHPLAVFGTTEAFERDPTSAAQNADEAKRVTAEEVGGYGFFVNVHALPQRTLFSSKRIAPSGKTGIMDVQTGTLKNQLIVAPGGPIISP